ncbi:MAG: DUF4388 domain-containing protein [Proteobacteria bacterium]|nr:DUF4388 domain-containing protein [Pseudomonadota bacterium]
MEIEVGGQIQGISLGSFLQIVHMDKTTCTLKIYSNDDIGYLYLKDGALVAAETGQLENVEAAYEILSWNKAVIIIDNAPIPDQRITVSLMSILMEGLRRKDEKNAQISPVDVDQKKELDVEFDPDTYLSRDEQIASQFVVDTQTKPLVDETKNTPEPPPEPPELKPVETDITQGPRPEPVATESEDLVEKDQEPVHFEGEEDIVQSRPPSSLAFRSLMALLILSSITFGGLYIYKLYLSKENYQRVISQVTAQDKLETMKRVLTTYINSQDDDNTYILDAISKMNDLNLLMDVERKIAVLSLDDDYKEKATELYRSHLKTHQESFLKNYITVKISEIPKILEAYDYKKLALISDKNRKERMKVYRAFLTNYPDTKNKQSVQNLIAAIGDEFFTDLSQEIKTCNKVGNWDKCLRLADDFITEFPEDTRILEIKDVRKKMQDRAEYADMQFKSSAMGFNDAKKMYYDYLQKYPETSLKKEIRGEITLLNRKIDFQSKWEETRSYCTNPQVSLNNRIKELKDYIERDYSGLFKTQSDALMNDLKKEEKIGRVRMAQLLKERQERERLEKIQAEKDRIAREKEMARLAEIKRKERDKRLTEESVRITKILDESRGRFKVHSDRTVTDTRTGKIWCLIDSNIAEGECMNYDGARDYVKNLNTGGYKDWRMPDSGELAILYNSQPYFPSSGATWYWTLNASEQVWGREQKAAVFFPDKKDEFEHVFKDQKDCGFVHAVRP